MPGHQVPVSETIASPIKNRDEEKVLALLWDTFGWAILRDLLGFTCK